jgi:hypothetical protein
MEVSEDIKDKIINKRTKKLLVEDNLKRIEEGEPLTVPLAILAEDLKRKYFKCMRCKKPLPHPDCNITGLCNKCHTMELERIKMCDPQYKVKKREYNREYLNRPNVKARNSRRRKIKNAFLTDK